jgi:hypothetical protein
VQRVKRKTMVPAGSYEEPSGTPLPLNLSRRLESVPSFLRNASTESLPIMKHNWDTFRVAENLSGDHSTQPFRVGPSVEVAAHLRGKEL